MKTRKVAPATVTLGAMVAAAFATLLGGAPSANAACASFWGMGGGNGQCSSTFGNTAIALGDTESASAVGGFGNTAIASGVDAEASANGGLFNTAIALGDRSTAVSAGFVSTSLAVGKNTTAVSNGVGNLAADIGDNTDKGTGSAAATGWLNRAINIGGDNQRSCVQRGHPRGGSGESGDAERRRQLGDQCRQGQRRPRPGRSRQRCLQHRQREPGHCPRCAVERDQHR